MVEVNGRRLPKSTPYIFETCRGLFIKREVSTRGKQSVLDSWLFPVYKYLILGTVGSTFSLHAVGKPPVMLRTLVGEAGRSADSPCGSCARPLFSENDLGREVEFI